MTGAATTPRHVSHDLAPVVEEPIATCTHVARKSMIKPRRPWAQASLSRTLCASFLCMARTGFSHIRLHRLSKGRPDSLVNSILLRQPWSGWCVGRRNVSADPTLSTTFLALAAWAVCSIRLADKSPCLTCPGTGGESPLFLEPTRARGKCVKLATFLFAICAGAHTFRPSLSLYFPSLSIICHISNNHRSLAYLGP